MGRARMDGKLCSCVQCGGTRMPADRFLLPDGAYADTCMACRGGKFCRDCETVKPVSEFYQHRRPDENRRVPGTYCKDCSKLRARKGGSERKLRTRFKMSMEQFAALLASQDGRCAACGSQDPDAPNWQVDHDHACCDTETTCGKCVRGLLCRPCNLALGVAKDDAGRLFGLFVYLATTGAP